MALAGKKKDESNSTNSTDETNGKTTGKSKPMKVLEEEKKQNLTDAYIETYTKKTEAKNYTIVGNVTIWNDSPLMYTERKASDTNDTIIYYPIWAIQARYMT